MLAYYFAWPNPVFKALADATRRQTEFELCTRLPAKLGLSSTRQAVSAP
jgi:hypothetical protein